MVKIGAAAVTASLCALVVRRGAPEFALLLTLIAGAWILFAVMDGLGAVVAMMDELARVAGLDSTVVGPVLKTVALALLTRVTVEVCRCAGEGGVAAFVEAAGTVLALVVALPLVAAVMTMLEELLR